MGSTFSIICGFAQKYWYTKAIGTFSIIPSAIFKKIPKNCVFGRWKVDKWSKTCVLGMMSTHWSCFFPTTATQKLKDLKNSKKSAGLNIINRNTVCVSDCLRKTREESELLTSSFLQMFRNLSNLVKIYKWNLDKVNKDVKNDVIVTSSGHYRAKIALFDNLIRHKIAKIDRICLAIEQKLNLIKYLKDLLWL